MENFSRPMNIKKLSVKFTLLVFKHEYDKKNLYCVTQEHCIAPTKDGRFIGGI